MELLSLLASLGIQLTVNPPVCSEAFHPAGLYENGTITVCVKDNVDTLTTIRHELIHHGQACLNSDVIAPGRDYLTKDFPYLAYDSEDWEGEAEARVLSEELSTQQLHNLLTWACTT